MSNYNNASPLKPVSERDSLAKALTKMKARRQGKLPSLITGWPKFNDAFCDGLEWKTITVIGARPGTGKTLFMEQLITLMEQLRLHSRSDKDEKELNRELITEMVLE